MKYSRLKRLLSTIDMVTKYSDDQERDEHGRWTSGGSSSSADKPSGSVRSAGSKMRLTGRFNHSSPKAVVKELSKA